MKRLWSKLTRWLWDNHKAPVSPCNSATLHLLVGEVRQLRWKQESQFFEYKNLLREEVRRLMDTLEEVKAALQSGNDAMDSLKAAVVAEQQEVADKLDQLGTQIQSLEDMIANGAGVTVADLQGLKATAEELAAKAAATKALVEATV